MYLRELSIRSFRNISQLTLSLHPKLNLFVGDNGEGKTNLVESIYCLSFGKSFRLLDWRQLISYGEDGASISAQLCRGVGLEERKLYLSSKKKEIFKDGKKVRSTFSSFPVILFSPESLLLFKESPSIRRDYFDRLLCQLRPTYASYLIQYKRALSQRNRILKEEFLSGEEKRKQIRLWEAPLIENGIQLIKERELQIRILNSFLSSHYEDISKEKKEAKIVYSKNVSEERFFVEQERRREEELLRGFSLVGPHRDDFLAILEERELRFFGSQGEMRSFILSMKLSEIKLLRDILQATPIFILDDLPSELDEQRSEDFFSLLKKLQGQIFATATSIDLFPQVLKGDFQAWAVEKGIATSI